MSSSQKTSLLIILMIFTIGGIPLIKAIMDPPALVGYEKIYEDDPNARLAIGAGKYLADFTGQTPLEESLPVGQVDMYASIGNTMIPVFFIAILFGLILFVANFPSFIRKINRGVEKK